MIDEKVILKEVGKVADKMDEQKIAYEKQIAAVTTELKDSIAAAQKKHEELIADNAAKGANIEQLQNEVKEIKTKGGRFGGGEAKAPQNLAQELKEIITSKKDIFSAMAEGNPFPLHRFVSKVVGNIASGNLTGDQYHTYLDWRPGMEPTGQTRFRDLVRVIQSDTDYVQFPRANNPVGEGSFGRQATEGVAKPQVDRDYTMIDLTLKPMAGYAIVSRQALRNIPFLQTWLPTSMLEQMLDAEDADFSNSLVAAASGSSTTSGITAKPERLIYFISNLIAAKHNVTAIAMDPAVWAALLVFRPGTDNGYGNASVITVDANGTVRILGRPVYPVNWLTGGRVIVGDFSKAAIVQSEGLTLRQSDSHASTFISNEITFLLERTEGLAVFRTEAFITAILS